METELYTTPRSHPKVPTAFRGRVYTTETSIQVSPRQSWLRRGDAI